MLSRLLIAVISVRQTLELQPTYNYNVGLTRHQQTFRILVTNYDIITYFFNLAFSSEHFISIEHRILATFNINKKIQF